MRKRILFKDEEISREIERRIQDEHLKEGDRLPSERRLAEEFGVQRDTVRCALEILLKKGVIISSPRQGYFVAPKKIELNLNNFHSIKKVIESVGNRSRAIILNYEIVSMGKDLAETTQLPQGTLCYQILRIRYYNNSPVSLEKAYIVAEYVPDMSKEDLESPTLASLLKHKYGITLTSAHQRITQTYADDIEAELMRISRDKPVIRYEGLVYDRKDRLIEYFDNVIIPDSIEFRIREYA